MRLRSKMKQGIFLATAILFAGAGCIPQAEREVVVYCALDREFSESILDDYEQTAKVKVLPKFDVESTKTVGLVTAIIEERKRPRCDLFWNNEMLHTLRLEKLGLLDVYLSPSAEDFPSDYVSADKHWHGFAARARILIVNTDKLPNSEDWPTSIEDLADPKWKGEVAIAKPLFGTTATHAAVLFDIWGTEKAESFFDRVAENAAVLSGNKQVALAVGEGEYTFGITDTDDAIIERDNGQPVAIVFPDQGEDQMGTLYIPNSLAIIRGSANGDEAKKLVDFLLKPEIESRLAQGDSAQFPVNPNVKTRSRAAADTPTRWMEVDFRSAADQWDNAVIFLRDRFQTAD